MKIAIIDADLIGRKKHRFPNLACMKISSYWKSLGSDVELKMDYKDLDRYDKVFISKVFMDTRIPLEPDDIPKTEESILDFYKDNPVLNMPNVEFGGTGFYYDKAPSLPEEIEHCMPDYSLYDNWVNTQLSNGIRKSDLTYYTDYSIGFTTRGCMRKCSFCVNKKYDRCVLHSHPEEFIDESRPYICLLDDNIFACPQWRQVFDSLIQTNKRFQFKQGLDERLLTDKKCEYLFVKSRWIGERFFAFDNIKDKDVIIEKLNMIRRHTDKRVTFYTFCAFNHDNPGGYDEEFWEKDIQDLMERIKILMEHGCLPFVMKYKDYKNSPYEKFYTTVARWCNQPKIFKKKSLREFSRLDQKRVKGECSSVKALRLIEGVYPEIAGRYFDMKWGECQ